MRRFLFTIICSMSLSAAFAQFAPVGTKWTFHMIEKEYPFDGQFSWTVAKDTIIDSVQYSVIRDTWNDSLLVTRDGSKVYYYEEAEKLLFFDFSVLKGDSVQLDLRRSRSLSPVVRGNWVRIDDVKWERDIKGDSVELFKYRVIDTSSWYVYEGYMCMPMLGGIGSIHPFSSLSNYPHTGPDYRLDFKCYEEPGGYSFRYTNACGTVGIGDLKSVNVSAVFPNPASDRLIIITEGEEFAHLQVRLSDFSGRVWDERSLARSPGGNGFQYPVGQIAQGIYILQTTTPKGSQVSKVQISR